MSYRVSLQVREDNNVWSIFNVSAVFSSSEHKVGCLVSCPQSRAECPTQVVSLAAWKVFVLQFTGGNDPMEPVLSPLGGSISPN